MRMRASILSVWCGVLAGCAGAGGPRPLAYAVPVPSDPSYVVGDTVVISLQGLGQSLEITARSAGTYRLHFMPGTDGVRVTASLEDLAADVAMPTADPIAMDETAFQGDFVFDLDSRGRPMALSSPEAQALGAQVFSAALVAHALFPRLSGSVAEVGDTWTDSTAYREEREGGTTEVQSNLTYTVASQSEADGRSLLDIAFTGPASVTQNVSLEGAQISLSSELQVEGRLRWDVARGLTYSNDLTMEGTGRVRTPLMPGLALPTSVRWQARVRLGG
jgi:hypothetical protein